MITLIYRHLKLFLKNPANIVLSFLSSLVILSLYFLFVRDFTIKAVGDYGFISNYNDLFVDRLMTSGLLIVIGATSVLSIIFIFVKDYYSGVVKDFLVTPVSYTKIVYSYFFAAFIVSMVITLFVYFGIEVFFAFAYQDVSSFSTVIFSVFIIFCSNIISSLLMLIVALMIRSFTSFSTFETLYGVVIGFFIGVYIPIGYYPNRWSYVRVNTQPNAELIIDPYDEKYARPISLAQQLRSKHYKIVGHGQDYEIYEKTFMFIL